MRGWSSTLLHLDEGVAYSVEGGAILRGHVRRQTIIASERVDLLCECAGTTSVCVCVCVCVRYLGGSYHHANSNHVIRKRTKTKHPRRPCF